MANPSVSDMDRDKRIGKYLVEKPRAERLFPWQQSGELEAYSDADWGGDNVTWRSVSAGLSLYIAEGNCTLQSKPRQEDCEFKAWRDVLGHRRGLDKAKHVDKYNLWIRETSRSGNEGSGCELESR